MGHSDFDPAIHERRPWNAGVNVGPKRPLTARGLFRKGGCWRIEGICAGSEQLIEIDLPADQPPPPLDRTIRFRPARSRIFPA